MSNVDTIHNTILNNIDDSYQKTEGYPTYDLTRGIAYGIDLVYTHSKEVELKQHVKNLSGDELVQVILERTGLERKHSTKAEGTLTVVKGFGNVLKGDLFETETGIQFESLYTGLVQDGDSFPIRALVGGKDGNVQANTIVYMPVTITGISKVTNLKKTEGGYDEETDSALIERYYDRLRNPINGVNANQYVEWAESVDGVGGAKCIPVWKGINTVKVVIIGSDFKPATTPIIKAVQNHIDPNKNGDGAGEAPIGAVTTIVSATSKTINISLQLTANNGVNVEDVKANIKSLLERYITSIGFKENYVSRAKIGQQILSVNGVKDYDDLKLNGKYENVKLNTEDCAVLGTVTYE